MSAASEEKKYVLEEDGFEEGEMLGQLNQGNGEAEEAGNNGIF